VLLNRLPTAQGAMIVLPLYRLVFRAELMLVQNDSAVVVSVNHGRIWLARFGHGLAREALISTEHRHPVHSATFKKIFRGRKTTLGLCKLSVDFMQFFGRPWTQDTCHL
jgi:hypothetical protein